MPAADRRRRACARLAAPLRGRPAQGRVLAGLRIRESPALVPAALGDCAFGRSAERRAPGLGGCRSMWRRGLAQLQGGRVVGSGGVRRRLEAPGGGLHAGHGGRTGGTGRVPPGRRDGVRTGDRRAPRAQGESSAARRAVAGGARPCRSSAVRGRWAVPQPRAVRRHASEGAGYRTSLGDQDERATTSRSSTT